MRQRPASAGRFAFRQAGLTLTAAAAHEAVTRLSSTKNRSDNTA
jgi:hypothetical protein